MVWTIIQISVRRLRHSPVEMLLTFVVPLAFFSIFALIFGGGEGGTATAKIKVMLIDAADNPASAAVRAQLQRNPGLRFMQAQSPSSTPADTAPVDAASLRPVSSSGLGGGREESQARHCVRHGTVAAAIVLESREQESREQAVTARILLDSSDPVAGPLLSALVQQSLAVGNAQARSAASQAPSAPGVSVEDVLRSGRAKPLVSMYAAGIAVMFLLFGASAGGGALLEEQENRTLDRLFATQLTMDQLLLGKWSFLTAVGVLQTTLMFCWGQLVFGIDLLGHWDGFLVMTLVTAGAAASFGLLLATLCRSRGQLSGLSVIVVLTMSALGGSMVPRYIMGENLQRIGLWTFNAWALDGYNKVFWRDLPVSDLWPQMSVLMVTGLVFLLVARVLAIRWETH